MSQLDAEEKEILEAFEQGNLTRAKNARQEIVRHQAIAEATYNNVVDVNVRLTPRDLRSLQARALKEGIPYQMLVSIILHKYVDGQLVDKAANK